MAAFTCGLYVRAAVPSAGGRTYQNASGTYFGIAEIPVGGLYTDVSDNPGSSDGYCLVLRTPVGDMDIENPQWGGRTGVAPNVSVPSTLTLSGWSGVLANGVLTDTAT